MTYLMHFKMQVIAVMQSWIMSIITSVSHDPSETMIICCSISIYDYYLCWKQFCCFIILCKKMIWWIRSFIRTAFIWSETKNVLKNFTFDQFNASLLNKSINLFKNIILLTRNV